MNRTETDLLKSFCGKTVSKYNGINQNHFINRPKSKSGRVSRQNFNSSQNKALNDNKKNLSNYSNFKEKRKIKEIKILVPETMSNIDKTKYYNPNRTNTQNITTSDINNYLYNSERDCFNQNTEIKKRHSTNAFDNSNHKIKLTRTCNKTEGNIKT